jgi:nifR3 family TIM-barrel protein
MDGYSDMPFRLLCRDLGSAMSYTEFIQALDVMHPPHYLEARLAYDEAERPVVFQLMDDVPERILQAARGLLKRRPDIIDVNCGCSSRQVSGRGAGAGLLRHPEKIGTIIKALSQEIPVPITAKIRLGWDDHSRNYLEVAQIIAENGASLIAVHGRTRQQLYAGEADWGPIAEIKRAVSIPVIANGDVCCAADIERIKQTTGCDGVMIGRAAVKNPWIFSRLDREQVSREQVRAALERHLSLMLALYEHPLGLIRFRKFAKGCLSPYSPTREQFIEMLTTEDLSIFWRVVDAILAKGR